VISHKNVNIDNLKLSHILMLMFKHLNDNIDINRFEFGFDLHDTLNNMYATSITFLGDNKINIVSIDIQVKSKGKPSFVDEKDYTYVDFIANGVNTGDYENKIKLHFENLEGFINCIDAGIVLANHESSLIENFVKDHICFKKHANNLDPNKVNKRNDKIVKESPLINKVISFENISGITYNAFYGYPDVKRISLSVDQANTLIKFMYKRTHHVTGGSHKMITILGRNRKVTKIGRTDTVRKI